jgi:hypothetical protein
MLAERRSSISTGSLGRSVLLEAESLYQLLEFVGDELAVWADRSDRTRKRAEDALTSQFCNHLNSASRRSSWDFVQFRTEVPDEEKASRSIDLSISPCNAVIEVSGRTVTDLDMLLPIECKRLPTPKNKEREETEYVFTAKSTTGGIQRFKDGNHGAHHSLAAMIGFVQEQTSPSWLSKVIGWVDDRIAAKVPGWSSADYPIAVGVSSNTVSRYKSRHDRKGGLDPIEIRHYWLDLT